MSQNKTVFPGMDSGRETRPQHQDVNSIYSRNYGGGNRPANGTVVPGMNAGYVDPQQTIEPSMLRPQQPNRGSGKPIVGFLYSISRTEAGEYWPLYIGQNTIGNSSKCSIMLSEATVSQEHAVLVIRKMKNPEKVIASISDARSTNGTLLNGESLGFSSAECRNGDILTFGESYTFVLILLDVKELGLKVAENFISTEPAEPDFIDDDFPRFTPGETRHGQDRPIDGTVGLDGSGTPFRRGGTVGMDD